jgi:hypothetical protein
VNKSNKQTARRLLLRFANSNNRDMSIEEFRILYLMFLITLDTQTKLKRQLRKIAENIKDDIIIDERFFVTEEQAKKLYQNLHDMIINGNNYDTNIELSNKATWLVRILSILLSTGQGLGIITSVFQSASKKFGPSNYIKLIGINAGIANFFFAFKALDKINPELLTDIIDFYSVKPSFKSLLKTAIKEIVLDFLALSASATSATFAYRARNEMGMIAEGYYQSLAVLITMGITYRRDLAALPRFIDQQRSTNYTRLEKYDIAKNIFKLLSIIMAAIRAYEFSKVAECIYKDDLALDKKIEQHTPAILAYYAMIPIMASMGFAAAASANFFCDEVRNFCQKLQTDQVRSRYQPQDDYQEPEDLPSAVNSSNSISSNQSNQFYKKFLKIMILVTLIINGFANSCLSNSTNPLIMLIIAYTSFAFCARSIFDKKENLKPNPIKLQEVIQDLQIGIGSENKLLLCQKIQTIYEKYGMNIPPKILPKTTIKPLINVASKSTASTSTNSVASFI